MKKKKKKKKRTIKEFNPESFVLDDVLAQVKARREKAKNKEEY